MTSGNGRRRADPAPDHAVAPGAVAVRHRRWLGATTAVVAFLLVAMTLLFDWNWLRGPLNRYVSDKTHREFTSSELHVRLGLTPTVRLRNVRFANAPGAGAAPMATFGLLEFTVSLRDLLHGRILIPRVALTDAQLQLERLPDGRKNWTISDPSDTTGSHLRIGSLSVTHGSLQYADRGIPFFLRVTVDTFDPTAQTSAASTDAAALNERFTTRYAFDGTYHDAKFAGEALTGDTLSFQESGVVFPLRGRLTAGTTRLEVEGTVADAAKLSAIDVRLVISGQTLANIYPFLLLPLPASPPYRLQGHLVLRGNEYSLDDIKGSIGSTDMRGSATYLDRKPRPLLQARLQSQLLDVADLGPLIGVTTKSSRTVAPATQAETRDRNTAKAQERRAHGERVLPAGTPSGERLLPTGKFEGGRVKAIDADAELTARRVKTPDQLDVGNVHAVLHLQDAMLRLAPLDFDFAGGRIRSSIDLDARQALLASRADVRVEQIKLDSLLPQSPRIARSVGHIDGHMALAGQGDSIADVAAKANGSVEATMSRGQISNLIDATAGLNGGKVLKLLLGGDKDIPVRCGAAAFDVKDGQGHSRLFLVDTAQTRIDAAGTFDLDHERFDLTVWPKPKQPGILSLRAPLKLYGTFRHADYSFDKKHLALRAGSAVALGLIAPPAALVPLIETGPGVDADCPRVDALVTQPARVSR
jgi:AsmA protein